MKTINTKYVMQPIFITALLLPMMFVYAQGQQQDRDQDRIQDPAIGSDQQQDRDQEQARVQTPAELRQYIQEQQQQQDQLQEGTPLADQQPRNQTVVAVRAVQAAESMLGQNGPRMSQVAIEMHNAIEGMEMREEALENRSWLRNFLFGQDRELARSLRQEVDQNQNRIQEMNQLMIDCGECDDAVKTMLQEQLQNMQQEQERLHSVAVEAESKRGIFGWLFRD